MKLQTDVSVQYALGEHKEALSLEDLEEILHITYIKTMALALDLIIVQGGFYRSSVRTRENRLLILPSRYSYKRNLLCENV